MAAEAEGVVDRGADFFCDQRGVIEVALGIGVFQIDRGRNNGIADRQRGERLSLRSIGLGTARWWKSILWGFIIAIVSAVVIGALAYLTGYGHGPGSAAFEKLPLWLITAIVFRAGVVEELFYRGYAIERLQMIGLGRFWSVAIPLVIFSLGHWSGGAANILIAFAAGLILTGFYLWRRDLAANMIGHGLVDFVANVLPKLFS